MSGINNPTYNYVKVMEFIDGGYLRKKMIDFIGTDMINYEKLRDLLGNSVIFGHDFPELIRAYYYDAIVQSSPENEKEWTRQNDYFDIIRKNDFYEVRLGRLIKSHNGQYRQKGVDILLATDMVTKAYADHYDIAILLAGDDDMVDLVKAVKDAGKRVYGAYFMTSASKRLKDSFDRSVFLDKVIEELYWKTTRLKDKKLAITRSKREVE